MKSIEACIKIIEQFHTTPPPPDGNFWLKWYEDYLRDYLNIAKINKIFPKSHFGINNKAIDKISKNNKIEFDGISLPVPLKFIDRANILFSFMDSFLTYLLRDIDQELVYRMFPFMREGPYEYKEVQLKRGDVVIDAGACIGEFSALSSLKGCTSYAFEPMPDMVDNFLSKTAQWNPNITISRYALSNKRGNLVFFRNSTSNGDASFVRKNGKPKINIQAIDLDTFAEENNLPSIDFIKADIEGAERYMLMGARRVLKEFAPKISICTYHLPDDPKVLRELILDANPNYVIEERFKKMYAYVSENNRKNNS